MPIAGGTIDMQRRDFLGWVGKVSIAIGIGSIVGIPGDRNSSPAQEIPPGRYGGYRRRMNGRACRDYRLISNDRSMYLDRDIFHS
jgi:hypothetical protein